MPKLNTSSEYKTKIVDGKEVLYGSWWIDDLEIEQHFSWYYQQADAVYKNCSRDMKILEIGVGTNLLSDLLKRRKWKITTLDIDAEKSPDICDSAYEFDYSSDDYQVILAFEIFEHIPFATFLKVIKKISHSGVRKIIFSLPWNEVSLFKLEIKLPRISKISINPTVAIGRISTPAHFWELYATDKTVGEKNLISLNKLRDAFIDFGFELNMLKKNRNIQFFSATR